MAASSSSTVDELQPQYQVFISFRRVGLRDGFVNHLVNALVNHKINYFIDNSEVRGQPLEDVVFKRIGTSRIALVILTSDYTESARRLQQLKKIKECVDEGKMVAIPIFYKLEPSTVRHMKGAFGDAFTNLEESDETKRKWKEALKSIPELMGIIVHEESYERSAVNEIVEGVQKVLQFTSVSNPRDAITRTNGDFFDR
ncbi:unnamed protein product [Thlaspi arvense]|uniref:TIR domain-containing protein n=1 Tax=Thlaspi arvense TaxID=13288 RepID=A0AAU9T7H9_THLAR|nr:unnamed protein product [Thlaspi arvense]